MHNAVHRALHPRTLCSCMHASGNDALLQQCADVTAHEALGAPDRHARTCNLAALADAGAIADEEAGALARGQELEVLLARVAHALELQLA